MASNAMPVEAVRNVGGDLEEGELYVFRKGHLEHIEREDDPDGMRRVRVMEEAYQAAMELGRRMRKRMKGYKPDVSLVLSALVLHAARQEEAEEAVRQFVKALFSEEETAAGPGGMPAE